jgi:hypothetical protein
MPRWGSGWVAALLPRRRSGNDTTLCQAQKLRALEHAIDDMADRVAQAELMADRRAEDVRHWENRALLAERSVAHKVVPVQAAACMAP